MTRLARGRGSLLPPLVGGGRGHLLALLVICGLLQAGSLAAAVWLTRMAIDGARAGEALPPFAFGLCLAGLVTAAARVWEKRLSERMGQLYVADLRETLLRAVATMPIDELTERRKGSLVLRYTGDLSSMRGWIGRGLVRIVVAGLTLPALVGALALVSPGIALVVGLALAIGLALTWAIGPVLQRRHHSARARRGALSVRMAERVIHPLTLRFASSLPRERARLRSLSERVIEESVRRGTMSASVRAIPDAAGGIALALVVLMGARAVAGGELTIGGLVAAVATVGLVTRPLREMAGAQDRRRAFVAARDRIVPILRSGRQARRERLLDPPGIRIPALGSIEPGRAAWVHGDAASGKTALLDALAGQGGQASADVELVIGGRSLDPATVDPRSIGYVSPRIAPFKGRVKALLRLRDRSLGDDGCEVLLRRAGAWDALAARGGLGAKVTEGGTNLPPSLRMRLMLAVALSGDPKLVLVDDAELLGEEGLWALADIASDGTRTVVAASQRARGSTHATEAFDAFAELRASGLDAPMAAEGPDLRLVQ